MAVQVVMMVVMAVVGSARAWPIAAPDSIEPEASEVISLSECGVTAETAIPYGVSLQVIFNVTDFASDCEIFLRVFVKEDNGLAKYGLRVSGQLHLNDDDCFSSLLLHDNDDDKDEAAISETFCGSDTVKYRTVEDIAIFSYKQKGSVEGGAEDWQGASMTVTPELVCGGDVYEDSTLAIHQYNFKAPYVCNWRLLPGEGQKSRLTFESFHLTDPKRNKCTLECVFFVPGDMRHYCGTQLMDSVKDLLGEEIISLRVNSAYTQFQCKVEYVPATRNMDHLPYP